MLLLLILRRSKNTPFLLIVKRSVETVTGKES